MYEKVSCMHPDKIADRIAGAMVDLAYKKQENPRVAIEVMIGHGHCTIIAESSVKFSKKDVHAIVKRISGQKHISLDLRQVPQDEHLAKNQKEELRCGDNGIFKGVPVTSEQRELAMIARMIYGSYPYDGKYLLDGDELIICQSHAKAENLKLLFPDAVRINPLGDWTGGTDVDTGAVNRKLGSDLGDSITGAGLHGKDLSKADVSVQIYAWLKAQNEKKPIELSCAIGDKYVDCRPYEDIVKIAHDYIKSIGGFERFAEWGLIR